MADPIVWPRRAAGVALTSQVSPAVHARELPKPCTKRETSRSQIESAVANTNVVTAITSSPATAVDRAPTLAVATPPGMPPRSAPAG
jgi:hypothetical protein